MTFFFSLKDNLFYCKCNSIFILLDSRYCIGIKNLWQRQLNILLLRSFQDLAVIRQKLKSLYRVSGRKSTMIYNDPTMIYNDPTMILQFSLQWLDWNHCRSIQMFAFGKKWYTKKEIKLQNIAVVPSCGDESYHNQSIFAHYFFFGWEAEKSIARSPTKFLYWKRTKTTKNCHGNIVELDLSANFRAYLEDARGPEPTAD